MSALKQTRDPQNYHRMMKQLRLASLISTTKLTNELDLTDEETLACLNKCFEIVENPQPSKPIKNGQVKIVRKVRKSLFPS